MKTMKMRERKRSDIMGLGIMIVMSMTMIMMMCPPSPTTEYARRQQDLKELCKPASSSLRGPAARTVASGQPPAERGWRILQNLN